MQHTKRGRKGMGGRGWKNIKQTRIMSPCHCVSLDTFGGRGQKYPLCSLCTGWIWWISEEPFSGSREECPKRTLLPVRTLLSKSIYGRHLLLQGSNREVASAARVNCVLFLSNSGFVCPFQLKETPFGKSPWGCSCSSSTLGTPSWDLLKYSHPSEGERVVYIGLLRLIINECGHNWGS